MSVVLDRLGGSRVALKIEIPADELSAGVEQAYRRLVTRHHIPGFRLGKAPRAVLERHVGKRALLEEAAEALVNEAYQKALREAGIEAVASPEVTIVTLEEGQPFVFEARVAVRPEVKLGDYTNHGLVYQPPTVTDEQVDQEVERLRSLFARIVPDEGAEVRPGSYAVIDFQGFVGDEPIAGGSGENYTLEIGSGSFIPGFEEQLVGMKSGQVREIEVTFPDDYRAKDLAGKPSRFEVKVHEVKRRELPPLDDELARQAGQFETLQALREDLARRMRERAEREARKAFEDEVVAKVVEQAELEIPHELVHARLHDLLHQLEHRLSHENMTLADYAKATGKTYEQIHDEMEAPAERQVRADLVLQAIAQQEGIEVSQAEVDEEIERLAQASSKPGDMRRLLGQPDNRASLQNRLRIEKTVRRLAYGDDKPA